MASWGSNSSGQLGNNSTTDSLVPVLVNTVGVLNGKTVIAVASSGGHCLALCSDGTVASWGSNLSGQLGNNGMTNSSVPVLVNMAGVLAGKTVIAVAAGSGHSLALCSDGTVASWGDNWTGQLGNDSTTGSSVPILVNAAGVLAGKTVIAVAAGIWHSLALCSDGTVVSWGYNASGQLGNNSRTPSHVPVAVNTTGVLSGKVVIALAGGYEHHLALCSDGTVVSWGENTSGQLGNITPYYSSVPVAVSTAGVLAGKTVIGVAAGVFHSLAVCSDGTLATWGGNEYGELGNNGFGPVPVAVNTSSLPSGSRFVVGTCLGMSTYGLSALPPPSPLTFGTPSPGILSGVGQVDEWTFYGRGGRSATVVVNPGSSGSPAPASPHLQWASVQLLDASNNVLASAANTTAGSVLSTAAAFQADGVYKVRLTQAAGHSSATGNYLVTVWDTVPNVRSLNINQQSVGNITTPFAQDQWTFSGAAGQQVQFDLINTSSSGLRFTVTGPSGPVVGLTNLATDSALINLPTSGAYIVTAFGLNFATGSYSFQLKQTSQTDLTPGTTYNGTIAGSGQAQLFKLDLAAGSPFLLTLLDSASTHHNELYVKFGAPPTRGDFDFSGAPTGANQDILVDSGTVGSWYVLLYSESALVSSTFTLNATVVPAIVTGFTPNQSGNGGDAIVVVKGVGFVPGSSIVLVDSGGMTYPAASVTGSFASQMTATFTAGSVPAGQYTLRVILPDGFTADSAAKFTFTNGGRANLVTKIVLSNNVSYRQRDTFYLEYANTGTVAMPVPLLRLRAVQNGSERGYMTLDNSTLGAWSFDFAKNVWRFSNPNAFASSVQILASGATPGVLQPGESGSVPIYWAGWELPWDFSLSPIHFSVSSITADDPTPMDWAIKLAPIAGAADSAREQTIANLRSAVGVTWGQYVAALARMASDLYQESGVTIQDADDLEFQLFQTVSVAPEATPALGAAMRAESVELPAVGVFVQPGTVYKYVSGSRGWVPLGADGLDASKWTFVIIHGLSDQVDGGWEASMASALASRDGTANILAVDWSRWASTGLNALKAAEGIAEVADRVAFRLFGALGVEIPNSWRIIKQHEANINWGGKDNVVEPIVGLGLSPNRAHLIGHSHGAHVAGLAAEYSFYHYGFGLVNRVTALDPSNPFAHLNLWSFFFNFGGTGWGNFERVKSANYIDSYRTSFYGPMFRAYGDDNFLLAKEGYYYSGNAYDGTASLSETQKHSWAHQWFTRACSELWVCK